MLGTVGYMLYNNCPLFIQISPLNTLKCFFLAHICSESTLIIILYIHASTRFMLLHIKALYKPEMKRLASESEEIYFFSKFAFDLT